jgi:YHS domain-containing protein
MVHYDPVCGRRMNPNRAYTRVKHRGETYYLCCPLCQSTFEKEPDKYTSDDCCGKKRRKPKHR